MARLADSDSLVCSARVARIRLRVGHSPGSRRRSTACSAHGPQRCRAQRLPGLTGPAVLGEVVWVPHGGVSFPATVLWECVDMGRARALLRYTLPGGLVVRRLHWRDELESEGVTVELEMRPVRP
jgi:hypothetical protein